MPRPQTGFFREPGSSLPGFIPALREHDLAGQLDELAHHARVRESEHASKALQALSGTDPALYPISSTVRPRVTAMLRRHATEWARIRSSPERAFMNAAGIARNEEEIRTQFAEEFAALEAEVTQKLEEITAGLVAKLQT